MDFIADIFNFLGLSVNKSKSCFITARPTSSRDTLTRTITGFEKAELPIIYLGYPLHYGRTTAILFSSLINKLQAKLGAWKGKIMSLGAKLILIKHVLYAMPSYLLALIHPPMIVIHSLNKIFADFFWNDKDGEKKLHWTCRNNGCNRTGFDVRNPIH